MYSEKADSVDEVWVGPPPDCGNAKWRSDAGMDLWQVWMCLWKTL